ncbi:MAG: hypothetical protein ABF747_00210 [Bifidobacterium sp.]|uniref:ScoMcrA-like SRA domain-containing protein n=1 Tax=Bifidobacterium fermentum TaxID=3059035 RepID=A0AB39UAX4_9BIFI
MGTTKWAITEGTVFKHKRDIRVIIGSGNFQSGIIRPKGENDVLLFSNPTSAETYGYSDREGMQEDGTYLYAAQGSNGDQVLTKGANKAVLETANNGGILRLFVHNSQGYQYVGAFGLADKPFIQTATNPNLYTFCLVSQGADVRILNTTAEPTRTTLHAQPWTPKTTDLANIPEKHYETRQAQQVEHVLEKDFGAWLIQQHKELEDLTIRVSNVDIKPDIFNSTDAEIIEAKASETRGYVRTAIGQVLDYVNNVNHCKQATNREHTHVKAALLLPASPEQDLVELCSELSIRIYCRKGSAFTELTSTNL